jgi:hypothetical protein
MSIDPALVAGVLQCPPFRLLVVSLTSLAPRCRLGEEESIPLLWVKADIALLFCSSTTDGVMDDY